MIIFRGIMFLKYDHFLALCSLNYENLKNLIFIICLFAQEENKCPGAEENGVSILHGNALAFVKVIFSDCLFAFLR